MLARARVAALAWWMSGGHEFADDANDLLKFARGPLVLWQNYEESGLGPSWGSFPSLLPPLFGSLVYLWTLIASDSWAIRLGALLWTVALLFGLNALPGLMFAWSAGEWGANLFRGVHLTLTDERAAGKTAVAARVEDILGPEFPYAEAQVACVALVVGAGMALIVLFAYAGLANARQGDRAQWRAHARAGAPTGRPPVRSEHAV